MQIETFSFLILIPYGCTTISARREISNTTYSHITWGLELPSRYPWMIPTGKPTQRLHPFKPYHRHWIEHQHLSIQMCVYMHSLHCRVRPKHPLSWDVHNLRAITIRSDICTWLEVCPVSLLSCSYINISVTENTNGNSPWWSIRWPIWGKVSHAHS